MAELARVTVDGIVDTMIGFPTDPDRLYATMRAPDAARPRVARVLLMPAEYMFHDVPHREVDPERRPGGRHAHRDGPLRHRGRARQPERRARGRRAGAHPAPRALRRLGHGRPQPGHGRDPRSWCGRTSGGACGRCRCSPTGSRRRSPSTRPRCTRCTRSASSSASRCSSRSASPGPGCRRWCQKVELLDQVLYDFPDLVVVMRHGAEPWVDLAVKLMLKWPNLHYSTSGFAPRYYPAGSWSTPTPGGPTG